MPNWREFYELAKVETNPQFLNRLLVDTESRMWSRLRDLDRSADGEAERNEIKAAFNSVTAIRVKKLGWPDSLSGELRTEVKPDCPVHKIEMRLRRQNGAAKPHQYLCPIDSCQQRYTEKHGYFGTTEGQ